jgi:hypothetical protein
LAALDRKQLERRSEQIKSEKKSKKKAKKKKKEENYNKSCWRMQCPKVYIMHACGENSSS